MLPGHYAQLPKVCPFRSKVAIFYQTSKANAINHMSSRKPALERRRVGTPARNSSISTVEKPSDYHHSWPAARSRLSTLLTKS
ncbi:hypothetical protein IEQ34_006605 [Dendrobium chrysotoxum]|uniref:Uncharacterized protein n=1 Tax=Dendrobium chrysotoxum TaxID=161865 RepID=A0AAV7H842_DENCH|nr:hypothetical protein IEQ34_006605 [Dendrobium chrysotoxum]